MGTSAKRTPEAGDPAGMPAPGLTPGQRFVASSGWIARPGALERVRDELASLLGPGGLVTDPAERATYASDGLAGYRSVPGLVTRPSSRAEVVAVVSACHRLGVPLVARGSGTGLSGGALPESDGVLLTTARMRRILELSPEDRLAVVEPGVTNAAISAAASPFGLYYAPDPSSQVVCSIGGNVAENSGGAHCLKYGFTTNHTLGIDVVWPDGTTATLGGDVAEAPGLDLRGLVVGSEGTLAIVTAVTVRLLSKPAAVATLVADFPSPEAAGEAVGAIIAEGVVPAAVEMMDNLAIQACEAATGAGYSLDAGAALLVELDGVEAECEADFERVVELCRHFGATKVRVAGDEAERALIWKARKAAFAAAGRVSPAYFVQDGVIPRTALGRVLAEVARLADEAGLSVFNVFHAGDGNLHPLVLYDPAKPGQAEAAESLAEAIIAVCVREGGSITGEHGVGVDKVCAMGEQFGPDDLAIMGRVRRSLDPDGLCNPGKLLPTPRLCGERPGPYRPHALELAGLAERW